MSYYNEITTKDYVAICPHCGNIDYRDIGEMPWDENEPEEITCEKCKKHFILTPIYDFRGWRSEPDENYYDEDKKDTND